MEANLLKKIASTKKNS